MREIGFLHPSNTAASQRRLAALGEGLKSGGFVDGQNITLIARWADYDPGRMAEQAEELVKRNVSVVVAVSRQAIRQVRAATSTLPIIALDLESDPVKDGFVQSLSRPGGNTTGLFFDFPEFSGKWLELLGEVIPGLSRVGVLWDPATGPVQIDAITATAPTRGVRIQVIEVASPDRIDGAFKAAADSGLQAVVALSSPIFGTLPQQVAESALRHRLPSIMLFPEYGAAGGLMAYGTELTDLFRQSGEMAAKVLAGAKPADLPVERPSRFRLVINLKTAKALNITVSPVMLLRADETIE